MIVAGARVVGEQEANARQLQEIVVDRLELVRQRIDARDRQREVRVVLVRKAQPCGLDSELEFRGIAVEERLSWCGGKLTNLRRVENRLVNAPGPQTLANQLDGRPDRHYDQDFDWLGEQRTLHDGTRYEIGDDSQLTSVIKRSLST